MLPERSTEIRGPWRTVLGACSLMLAMGMELQTVDDSSHNL
jgi:hypothetical protein